MTKNSIDIIKKRRELFQIERFKECFPEIADSEISIVENDPPDGVVQIAGNRFAVELTQILWDKDIDGINKKAQESIADMIMDLAEEKYTKLDLPYVQVNVSFTDNYGLRKHRNSLSLNSGDKSRLSDYIVRKVVEYVPLPENQLFEVPEYDENWKRILDPKIESIYIEQYSQLKENCWTASGGGTIPTITIEKIKNAIEKKNKELYRYKNFYDQTWLVIVEDTRGISGYFDFRNADQLFGHTFKSKFDRIFILRNGKRKIFELKIAQ